MHQNLVATFRELSEELCSLIEKEGLSVRPYDQMHLPYFLRLDSEAQNEAIKNLKSYLEICHNTIAERSSLKDASFFIKKALEHYKFSADARIYDFVGDDIVAEFYNLQHTQIFRTLAYFERTSYTIEDIYCRQWLHLYDRESQIGEQMYSYAMQLVQAEQMDTMVPQIEEHIVAEKASLEKIESLVRILCISTLMQDKSIAGLFASFSSKPISF